MAPGVERVVRSVPNLILPAVVTVLFVCAMGCGADELKCVPPADSIATDGTFDLDFTGETASFVSATMPVRITVLDDANLELWACQERGEDRWIAEISVSRPSTITLPANFGISADAPQLSAWLTRYAKYQVTEDQLGVGLNAQVLGSLTALDTDQGALRFDGTLREPCNKIQCQAARRTLALDVDLTWTPR